MLIATLSAPAHAAGFQPLLLRVRAEATTVPAGGSVLIRWWWQNVGDAPMPGDVRVFVHPRLPGRPDDSYRPFGGDYATSVPPWRWLPGDVVEEVHALQVPDWAQPGKYEVLVGMYHVQGGERLHFANPQQMDANVRLRLFDLQVLPKGSSPPAEATPADLHLADRRPVPLRPPARERAKHVITLRSGPAEVDFDPDRALVLGYRLAGAGDLPGEQQPIDGAALLCKTSTAEQAWTGEGDASLRLRLVAEKASSAAWAVECLWGGERAAEARLEATLDGPCLRLKLRDVHEEPGYHLLYYRPGALASVTADGDHRAQAAWPWHSGRVLYADDAEGALTALWGPAMALTCGTVAQWQIAATGKVAAIVQPAPPGIDALPAAGCGLLPDGRRWIWQSVWLVHRLQATRPEAQIRAYDEPEAEVTLVGDDGGDGGGDGRVDWQDAARHIWEGVHCAIKPIYRDHLVYKIFLDAPGMSASDATTFAEALDVIKRIHNLSGGQPAVVQLVGWQYRGHDTGYPATDKVNVRLGGYEGLLRLIHDARQYDASVTFHDNFDDAYMDSPRWDPRVICHDPEGNLMKGGVWAGGQSYIIAHHKYMRPGWGGPERIRETCERYPVRDTYHIDVLTSVPDRVDYDPADPGNGEANFAGKLKVIKLFNEHGLDVNSEALTWPFIGPVCCFRALAFDEPFWGASSYFVGGRRAPVVPMAIHGKVSYGGAGASWEGLAVAYGYTFAVDWRKQTPERDIAATIYERWLPWRALAGRRMEAVEEAAGGRERVVYGDATDGGSRDARHTYVDIDPAAHSWRAVVDGYVLARDGAVVAPNGSRELLAYSETAQTLDWRVPADWPRDGVIEVAKLSGDGAAPCGRAALRNGRFTLAVEPGQPYRLRLAK